MSNRGDRSRQSIDSTAAAAVSEAEARGARSNGARGDGAAAAAAAVVDTPSRQPRGSRSSWDDATIACMLRLRFQELRDHFLACKTVFETAEAWVVLVSQLNSRMGSAFESHQVQAKWLTLVAVVLCCVVCFCATQLKTLRQKWDLHTAASIRAGKERKTPLVESLALMTQLYREKAVTPLKQIGKAAPLRQSTGAGAPRQQDEGASVVDTRRRGYQASLSSTAAAEEEDESDGGNGSNNRDEEQDRGELQGDSSYQQQQGESGRYNRDDSASELYSSQRVAIERQHLELFERQVTATEALARHMQERLQVAKGKLRAAQEQVQVSRDQVELNLFAIQPDPEDDVAHEYLSLKRQQARDRLREEFFAMKRKQNAGVLSGTSSTSAGLAPASADGRKENRGFRTSGMTRVDLNEPNEVPQRRDRELRTRRYPGHPERALRVHQNAITAVICSLFDRGQKEKETMRTRRWQPQQMQHALTKSATATYVPVAAAAAATSSDGDSSDSDARNSSSSGDHGDSDGSDTTPATTRAQITNYKKKQQKCAMEQKQPHATWDDDALVCLLQLRYVEMDDHFRNECVTSADMADAWSVLANELNLRMEVAFSSLQCRSRIIALRKRWDEHSIANIRNGTEQRTKHVEAIKLLTRLYRRGIVAPLQQVAKIVPRSDCRGHKRFAEGFSEEEDDVEMESGTLALRRKQQEQDVDDYEEEEDTTSLDGDENELQPHVDGENGANAAATLWLSNTPLTLARRHLELFRRQVLAEEAIAQATQQRVEATKQRIRAEREQLQLSRDELELKLFAMAAAAEESEEEECVKCEFVAMKRRQVMDCLARDFMSTEQFEEEAERE